MLDLNKPKQTHKNENINLNRHANLRTVNMRDRVRVSLRTTVVNNTAQNSSDYFPS